MVDHITNDEKYPKVKAQILHQMSILYDCVYRHDMSDGRLFLKYVAAVRIVFCQHERDYLFPVRSLAGFSAGEQFLGTDMCEKPYRGYTGMKKTLVQYGMSN